MMVSRITTLIQIFLTLSCIIHVGYILHYILYPELPEIKVNKKHLKDINFPISFLICATNYVNQSGPYQEIGYSKISNFFKGISMFNDSILGWKGHRLNGSIYGTAEGQNTFEIFSILFYSNAFTFSEVLSKISHDWKNIIYSIRVTTIGQNSSSISGENIQWSLVPLYPECQALDLLDYFNFTGNNTPHIIEIDVWNIENYGISVYLLERNKALTRRTLKSNLLAYSGPVIENKNLEDSILLKLMIR